MSPSNQTDLLCPVSLLKKETITEDRTIETNSSLDSTKEKDFVKSRCQQKYEDIMKWFKVKNISLGDPEELKQEILSKMEGQNDLLVQTGLKSKKEIMFEREQERFEFKYLLQTI